MKKIRKNLRFRFWTLFSITILLFQASVLVSAQSRRLERENKTNTNQTESRTALVIGNGTYRDSPLRNPINDAADMSATLKTLGFEVLSYTNLDQNSMKRAIREFGAKLQAKGGVGLYYYAGHGVQVKGKNYLIPVGAQVNTEEEIEYESVEVGLLLAQMESAGNNMNIVILDACRNNPFARSFRSADKGLASIDAPSGTLIAYATAPGSVASDGESRNGIYTQELLKHIQSADLTIEDVFKRVRADVRQKTQGKQTPWESSSLINDFYFSSSGKIKPVPPPNIGKQPQNNPPKQDSKPDISKGRNDSFVKKEAFFTFELHKCSKSGTQVSCELSITNNDTIDKLLGFGWLSGGRIYDEDGIEGKMDGWQIANQSSTKAKLLPEVPVKARLRFKNISPQAKMLKRIELSLTANFSEGGYYKTKDFRVEFRDVSLR